jgi:hypothetical protein
MDDFEKLMNNKYMCPYAISFAIRNLDEMGKRVLKLFLGDVFEVNKWMDSIPFISWPLEWEVKYYPSYDCLLRGIVRRKDNHNRRVSFYCDGYSILGFMYDRTKNPPSPIPYWEIYNISDDLPDDYENDTSRFFLEDIDSLVEGIRKELHWDDEKSRRNRMSS